MFLAEGVNENEMDIQSDGDELSDGDSNSVGSDVGLWRSSRSRTRPDRLTYQQLGGIACLLAYNSIAQPKTIWKLSIRSFRH